MGYTPRGSKETQLSDFTGTVMAPLGVSCHQLIADQGLVLSSLGPF